MSDYDLCIDITIGTIPFEIKRKILKNAELAIKHLLGEHAEHYDWFSSISYHLIYWQDENGSRLVVEFYQCDDEGNEIPVQFLEEKAQDFIEDHLEEHIIGEDPGNGSDVP